MKKLIRWIALALAGFIPAFAQLNTLSTTTLSSAITSITATQIVVASATNIFGPSIPSGTAGSMLYIDKEAMQVYAVSGTTVSVLRATSGTTATTHAANVNIWIGNADWFNGYPVGTEPAGSCTKSTLYAYPRIHIFDATVFVCDSESMWGYGGPSISTHGLRVARTTVNDAAYTALPYDYYIAWTAITAARVLTLPSAAAFPGKVYIVKDESGSATSTNKVTGTFDGGAGTTCVGAAYGSCRLISRNGAWWSW